MITGDKQLGCKYRDLIIKQLETELKPNKEKLQRMKERLNNASSDELERLYESFERFGVQTIIDVVCK